MENHTEQSENFPNENTPLKLIVDLCSHLADKGLVFEISLNIKNSLQFTLKSDKKASVEGARGRRRRGPSYARRQEKRKLLKKKTDSFLEEKEPRENLEEESSSDDSESHSGSNASEPEAKHQEHEVDPADDHWSPVPPVSSTSSFPNLSSYRFEYQRRKREERRTIDPWTGRPRVSIVDTYKRHMIKEHRMQGGRGSFVYHCVFAPADIARADVEREALTPNSTKLKEINGTYGNQEFSSDGIFHLTGSEIFPQKNIWS